MTWSQHLSFCKKMKTLFSFGKKSFVSLLNLFLNKEQLLLEQAQKIYRIEESEFGYVQETAQKTYCSALFAANGPSTSQEDIRAFPHNPIPELTENYACQMGCLMLLVDNGISNVMQFVVSCTSCNSCSSCKFSRVKSQLQHKNAAQVALHLLQRSELHTCDVERLAEQTQECVSRISPKMQTGGCEEGVIEQFGSLQRPQAESAL